MDQQRRKFMFVSTAAGLAVAGIGVPSFAEKAPAAMPMVDEKDAIAVALGYVANATKVDKVKYKQFAAGSNCANCTLYQGKTKEKAGGCPLFSGKQVASDGWCISWAKKA